MPLRYEPPAPRGALRQGELLEGVFVHTVAAAAVRLEDGSSPPIASLEHNRLFIVHSDCDLEQDYHYREIAKDEFDHSNRSVVPSIFLCDTFELAEIRSTISGSDIWRRMKQNQDERYHHLDEAEVLGRQDIIPELLLDFKRTLTIAPNGLYEAVAAGGVRRRAVLPPIYVHDLIQRFFSYHSRVGIPD